MVEGQEWAVEGADEESKNDETRVRKLTQWGIGVITLVSHLILFMVLSNW